jgi:hypothetical protein
MAVKLFKGQSHYLAVVETGAGIMGKTQYGAWIRGFQTEGTSGNKSCFLRIAHREQEARSGEHGAGSEEQGAGSKSFPLPQNVTEAAARNRIERTMGLLNR